MCLLLFWLSHCPWRLPAAHANPLRHTTGHGRYNFVTGLHYEQAVKCHTVLTVLVRNVTASVYSQFGSKQELSCS
jgi:hypothetical protein